MKNLFLIGGTMGVGKTAVCSYLKHETENCVFLDGDWCWDANPFLVTEETKRMVMENICYLLNQFIRCSAYQTIFFCWVMHEQQIIDEILERLDTDECIVRTVSLLCDETSLRERLRKDISSGIRLPDVVERSLQRLPLYRKLDTVKIETSGKSIPAIAREILNL